VIVLIVAGVVVVLLLVWIALLFNRLVKGRNLVADAWSGVDVQLTRRAELVPNLVEAVKGYRDFERRTLEELVEARSRAIDATGPAAQGQAEQRVAGSLKTVFAVAEAYPDLKADRSFRSLQEQLATLEEDIAFARRYYNAQVRAFNTRQQTFPSVLAARPLGFRPAEYFQAEADERDAPSARV
jgi:LemA protein